MSKQCMVLLVDNNAGVLARVSSLFMQRGFNIDSLTVSSTEIPTISRITVTTKGDDRTFSQIIKQTSKLTEARLVFPIEPFVSIIRELLLVKFSTENVDAERLESIIDDYGAKVIDVSNGCFVAELTGDPTLIDDFLDAVKPFRMIEMCRTGATALESGKVSYDIQ